MSHRQRVLRLGRVGREQRAELDRQRCVDCGAVLARLPMANVMALNNDHAVRPPNLRMTEYAIL